MHGTMQPSVRSPKRLNSVTTPQLKASTDCVHNMSQSTVKKRERADHILGLIKRDSDAFRPENMLKSEISNITEKGVLVTFEGVEKLVHLMRTVSAEKKVDLSGRKLLVDVITVTDRFDCLGQFVQLRGLPVLDGWLQEVHKLKIGDGKEDRKNVEEFLLVLLCALDKLPVNLDALQTCNVGKSVNHLRNHRNSEIQKKSRCLVDRWKKRVEAEMNMIDSNLGSNRSVSWPSKAVVYEISRARCEHIGASSDVGINSSNKQSCSYNLKSVQVFRAEDVNRSLNQHLEKIEEKRSSSSQSQTNSQSCSSDHIKTVGSSYKEDVKSSTLGSQSVNKVSNVTSRLQKSSVGFSGSSVSGIQKETMLEKCSPTNKNLSSAEVLETGLSYEKVSDMSFDNGINQRLIRRLQNTCRIPARSSSDGRFEDMGATDSSSPSLSHLERNNHHDGKLKGQGEALWVSSNDDCRKLIEVLRPNGSLSGIVGKSRNTSFSSINALAESCVKFSEACASTSASDDFGINLLASVAVDEILKSDDSCSSSDSKLKQFNDTISRIQGLPLDGLNGLFTTFHVETAYSLCVGNELKHYSRDSKAVEHGSQLNYNGVALQQYMNIQCPTSYGKANDLIYDAPTALPCVDGTKYGHMKTGENKQLHEQLKVTVHSVLDSSSKVRSPSCDKGQKTDSIDEISIRIGEVMAHDTSGASVKVEKEAYQHSLPCSSSECRSNDKNPTHNESKNHLDPERISEDAVACPSFGNILIDDSKDKTDNETLSGNSVEQNESQKVDQASSISDQNSEYPEENLQRQEVSGQCSDRFIPQEVSSAIILKVSDNCTDSRECKLPEIETNLMDQSASLPTTGLDLAVKFDFDLNECIPDDNADDQDPKLSDQGIQSSIHLPPLPASSVSDSVKSITVAFTAKETSVPPKTPSSSTGELEWKGSALTGAFRPSKPINLMIRLSSIDASTCNTTVSKQAHLRLDIDLNVADESVEDLPTQTSFDSWAQNRGSTEIDLNLNIADENHDPGQFISVGNIGKPEIPSFPDRPSLSRGSSKGGFDLNIGPVPDEVSIDIASPPCNTHPKNNSPLMPYVPGVRMNSCEFGSTSSWYPPRDRYSTNIIVPNRTEENYPAFAIPSGSQRIFGLSIASEIYRGPMLTSLPSSGFPQATLFQYPGFPFEAGYAMSTNPGGSLCSFPAIPSQLARSSGGVASLHCPRPYVMNLLGSTSNVSPESRTWGNQVVNLNGTNADISSRQFWMGEQLKMFRGEGIVSKRKEPEGVRDIDRGGYKQPPWK